MSEGRKIESLIQVTIKMAWQIAMTITPWLPAKWSPGIPRQSSVSPWWKENTNSKMKKNPLQVLES